jgi:hypothetical protein
LFSRFQPFSPTSLAGLTGWWDASDPATLFDADAGGSAAAADGQVGRLEDKSGAGRNLTQATSANRPTRKTAVQNGLDVLRFDGVNDRMGGPLFSTLFSNSEGTCFVVAKATAATTDSTSAFNNAAVFSDVSAGQGFFGVRSNSTAYSFGNFATASLSYTTGNWVCFTTDHDSPTLRVTVNKTTSATESLESRSNTDSSTILGANWNQTVLFDGDVGEVITYNVALGTADREAVETYLMDKWGIT